LKNEKEWTKIGTVQGDTPLHRGASISRHGNIFFGDYFMNPDRKEVHIYQVSADGSRADIAHSFPAGQIRHVHGVHQDTYLPDRLWVTVGDEDGENFLYYTDDEFNSIEQLGDGSQMYRTVGLLFSRDHIHWVTDSPYEENYSITMDRNSGLIKKHQPFPSTVWYQAQSSDGFYYCATTVEKGPAVKTKFGALYASKDAVNWEEVARFPKDLWPMPHFKWGSLSLPSGGWDSKNIWISGEGLSKIDGKSIRISEQ